MSAPQGGGIVRPVAPEPDLIHSPLYGGLLVQSNDLEKTLYVPDTHRPYHNKRSVGLMLNAAAGWGVNRIVVIGDLADFYSVSRHSKNPKRSLKLDWEIKDVNKGLDELDSLGATDKRFCLGNHEVRLQSYLQDRAPELYDFLDVPSLFRLDKRGWKVTQYKDHDTLGKLYLTHDVGFSGRYAVYQTGDTFNHSVVTGHSHRMGYVVENDATGKNPRLSAQFGWLGDTEQLDYMHKAKARKFWPQGFGIGYSDGEGIQYLSPIPIIYGKCVVEGKLYRA